MHRYLQFGSVYKVNLIGMPNLVVLNDLDAARSLLKVSACATVPVQHHASQVVQ